MIFYLNRQIFKERIGDFRGQSLKEALHFDWLLSSDINSGIATQMGVWIFTFKVAVSCINVTFISFFVSFDVIVYSIFHFITSYFLLLFAIFFKTLPFSLT